MLSFRPQGLPSARRVESQRLLCVALVPFAAAVAMASAVAATGTASDAVAEAGGALAFILNFVKFCYLAVAMAHLSGAVTERVMASGSGLGLWMDELNRGRGPAEGFWDTFPNHVDGSAIALAVTLLCWMLT